MLKITSRLSMYKHVYLLIYFDKKRPKNIIFFQIMFILAVITCLYLLYNNVVCY